MSESVPTAKVYVFKSKDVGEEGKPWHVATDQQGMVVITKSFDSHAEAWGWLEENYVRETP